MISGLKRSMPCDDLIALEAPQTQKVLLETSVFLDDSVRHLIEQTAMKRQRIVSSEARDSISFGFPSNPATAALEAALASEDSPELDALNFSLFTTFAADFNLGLGKSNDAFLSSFPCTNLHRHHAATSHSHVKNVEDLSCAMSRITTASKA